MRRMTILIAAALFAAPAQALPQDSLETTDTGAETRTNDDDGGNPRLGLLGLLGLAGLLGLMRREPDIHIDARGGKQS
jgi:MYXO-CTERM domain-containing protein